MKRVLNSGSIKLPYIQGSEKDVLDSHKFYYPELSQEEVIKGALNIDDPVMGVSAIRFTFEICMPLLVAQSFYNSHLGVLKFLEDQDHQTAYLPPSFYRLGPSVFVPMDPKSCNELNTKLNNFYNWSFNFYNKLVENGLCFEQAKLVLPQGIFVTYLWEVTAKDLILFIEQNHGKSPEMAGYCSTLVLYMEDHLPNVTAWLKRNQWKDLI